LKKDGTLTAKSLSSEQLMMLLRGKDIAI